MFGETKAAAVAAWNVRVVKFDVAIEKSQETRMVVSSKAIDGGAAVEKAERVLDSYVRAVDASDDAGIEGCLAQMMGDPVCLTGVLSIHYAIWKKWMRDRKPDA